MAVWARAKASQGQRAWTCAAGAEAVVGRKAARARGNAGRGALVEAKSGRRIGGGVLHGPAGSWTGRRA